MRRTALLFALAGLVGGLVATPIAVYAINTVRSAGMLPVLWAFHGHERRQAKAEPEETSRVALLS